MRENGVCCIIYTICTYVCTYMYMYNTLIEMDVMAHQWDVQHPARDIRRGVRMRRVNKRRVNRRRMESGILKYVSARALSSSTGTRWPSIYMYTTERTRRRAGCSTIQYSCDNTIKNVPRPKVSSIPT